MSQEENQIEQTQDHPSGIQIDPEYSITKDKAKELISAFRTKVRLQNEPIDDTRKIVKLLEQLVVNQEKLFEADAALQQYLFNEGIENVIKTLAQLIKIKVNNIEFLEMVRQISQALPYIAITNLKSAELVDSIKFMFDHSTRLHKYHFLTEENAILKVVNPESYSEEERAWREALDVGSELDAVKLDPSDHLGKMWSKCIVKSKFAKTQKVLLSFYQDTSAFDREVSIYSKELATVGSQCSEDFKWRESLKAGDLVDCWDSTGLWYASTILQIQSREFQGANLVMAYIGYRVNDPNGDKIDDQGNKFFGWEDKYDDWVPLYSSCLVKYQTHTDGSFKDQTSAAQNGTNTYLQKKNEQKGVDDELDMGCTHEKGQLIYAVQRKECRSDLLTVFLNTFGRMGGFDQMLTNIKDQIETTNGLVLIAAYIECIGRSAPMFHRQFVDSYFKEFIETIKQALTMSTTQQLRVTKKERFDEIIDNIFKKIVPRMGSMSIDDAQDEKLTIQADLGVHFLSQTFFDKRIDGIKLIGELSQACVKLLTTSATGTSISGITTDERRLNLVSKIVSKFMKDDFILDQLFSRDKTHSQIIQRSEKVLKLLFIQKVLTDQHRDIIWKQTQTQDDDSKEQMVKALISAADEMQEEDKLFFLSNIKQVAYEDITDRHIQLVTELGTVKSSSSQDAVKEQVLSFLWHITFESENKCVLSIVNRSSLAFSAAVRGLDFEKQMTFICQMIDQLKQNKQGYLVLKTLQGLLKGSCDPPKNSEQYKTLADVINYLEKEHGLLEVIFANFENYMIRVQQAVKSGQLSDVDPAKLDASVIADLFMHGDQITLRLEFIRFYATSSPDVQLTTDQFKKMWDLLILNSPVEKDEKQMYKWMREVTDQVERLSKESSTIQPVVSMDQLIEFYHSKIAVDQDDDADQYKLLSIEGYQCRQSFFVLINNVQGKLRKVSWESGMYKTSKTSTSTTASSGDNFKQKATKSFTSYNSETGAQYSSYSFNTPSQSSETQTGGAQAYGPLNKNETSTVPMPTQKSAVDAYKNDKDEDPDDLEVESLVKPNELDGINMMWRIATESTSKNVINSAGKLLVSVHQGVSAELRSLIPEFDDIFISRIFQIIDDQIPKIDARTQEQKDEILAALAALPSHASTIQILRVTPPEERKIIRSLFLLRQMIRSSEKDGTFGLRPHSALSRGTILSCLQITNSINHSKGFRSRIEIAMDSNATMWDLKKRIGEEIMKTSRDDGKTWEIYPKEGETEPLKPFHPASIRIFQMSSTKDVKDLEHGTTLSELNFKNNETLGAFKKSSQLTQKAQIVVDDEESGEPKLTALANQVTEEIFSRYCSKNEQGEQIMQIADIVEYTKDCTATSCDEKDHRVVDFLNKYDSEKKGYVTVDQLKVFYVNAVVRGQELTLRNNFENLGYGPNLKKLPVAGDDSNSQQVRKSAKQMPRFKVSQNQKQFNTLMSLLEYEGEVNKRAVEAINMHATNPVLFKKVKSIENITESDNFDWNSLFEGNVHSQLYTLEIIEAILMGDGDSGFMTNWVTNFVAIGGLQQLQQRLTNALNDVQKHQNHAYKKYIEQLLKLVKIFVTVQQTDKKQETEQEPQITINLEEDKEYTTPTKPIKRHWEAQDIQITQNNLFEGLDPDAENLIVEGDKIDEPEPDSRLQLKKILSAEGMHDLVSSKVDIEMLKAQSIQVVGIFIGGKTFDTKDRPIVESAMSLWETIHIEQNQSTGVPIEKDLLISGLIECQEKKVRECFRDSISRIGKNQENMFIFLQEFIIDIISNISKFSKSTYQFFGLTRKIISKSSDKFSVPPNDFIYKLIENIVSLLSQYESYENKNSLLSDQTLQGSLDVLADAFNQLKEDKTTHNTIIELVQKSDMINILLYRCLFFQQGVSEQYANKNKVEVIKAKSLCSTKDSRKAGFRALKEYLGFLKPAEMLDLLINQVQNIVQDVQRPSKWRHLPSSSSRSNSYCGIVNLGCICYMISVLQQFFMVPAFRYQVMKAEDKTPPNMGEFKDEKFDDNLLRQLQILYGYLELSERQAGSAKGMCFSYKDWDGQPTKIGEQKDSQEFLNFFIERLEEQLKPTSQKDLFKDIFTGQTCELQTCMSCGKEKHSLVNFYCLSLDVKGIKGVHQSLSNMKKGEIIEDFRCEGCNEKINLNKRSLLATMPNMLILHLKRIVFSFETYQNEKVNSHFEFPRILDLKDYSVKANIEESNDDDIKKLMETDDDEYIYRLVGINIHEGTADAGHYYSIINTKRGSEEADPYEDEEKWKKVELNPWKEFNDSTVSIFQFDKNIEKEAFGGDQTTKGTTTSDAMSDADLANFLSTGSGSYGKSAYMLFYERKKKRNLTEYIDDKQEQTREINYNKVEKSVPEWISEMVKNDNKSFLVDSQVFDDQFFDFLREIFKVIGSDLVLTSHMFEYDYNQKNFPPLKTVSLKLINKIVMDMLAYYDRNTAAIVSIVNSASSIMTFSDSKYEMKAGKNSLVVQFLRSVLIDDRGAHFFNIMFNCTDHNSRDNVGKLVQHSIVRLIKLYDDCDLELRDSCEQVKEVKDTIDVSLDIIFNELKEKQCHKAWTKLEAYFDMLLGIVTSCFAAVQTVLDRSDLISDLIDFILGNKSPRAAHETEKRATMGGVVQAPFHPLYTLISLLVRATYTSQMDLEVRLGSHYEILKDDIKHTPAKTYFLSDEAQIMLTKTDFLEKVIFDTKYDLVEQFSRAISHLCYRNIKLSRKVCKKILKAVSYSSNDQVQRHLVILLQIAQIKDEFQVHRLEFLFGFGFIMFMKKEGSELMQYGAEIMKNSTSQEVFQISTPIDTRIFDDSLLNLLWKYKGRMDSFTLSCLESLGNLMLGDDLILEYFASIPAPHYNLGRYTDWVLPYLVKQREDSIKYSSGSGTQEKLQTISNVQQLFESYEQRVNQIKSDEKFYIVTEVVNETIVSQNTFDDAVELTVYKIHAKFIESIPTGTSNMSMDFSKKEKSEEQKMQDAAITGQLQSKISPEKGPEEEAKELLQTSFELKELSCNDLLYRIHAKNLMQSNLMIKLDFVPNDASEQIDLAYPAGGIKDYLKPDADFPVFTLRRKNPFGKENDIKEEMSKLNIMLKWKTYGSDDYTVSNYATTLNKPDSKNATTKQITSNNNQASSTAQGRRNAVQLDVKVAQQEFQQAETLEESIAALERQEMAEGGVKACPYCTFDNPASNKNCQICDGLLG